MTCGYLDKGKFPALFNTQPLIVTETINITGKDKDHFIASISESKALVNKYFLAGDSALLELCDVYYGLEPRNVLGSETWYDDYLLLNIPRPKTELALDKGARNKYCLEHFGLDENNEYVDRKRTE